MELKDLKDFINFYDKLDKKAEDVFNLFKDAGLLDFGRYAAYEYIELTDCSADDFVIRYYDHGYDLYEYSLLTIPTRYLCNEGSIKEYIQTLKMEKEKRIYEIKEKEEKRKLEKEKEEYERLKAKFES